MWFEFPSLKIPEGTFMFYNLKNLVLRVFERLCILRKCKCPILTKENPKTLKMLKFSSSQKIWQIKIRLVKLAHQDSK